MFLPTPLPMTPKATTAGMADAFAARMKNDLFFHFRMKIYLIFSFFTGNDFT